MHFTCSARVCDPTHPTAQRWGLPQVWKELFPFADKKTLKAARLVGLREEPQALVNACGGDAEKYVRLLSALCRIELSKAWGDF